MRLVHLSDLHLGFRAFPGSERAWNRREADLARAFRWAVRSVVRLRPDLVLITGDLFDRPDPPSTAVLAMARGLQTLRSHLPEVQVLAIAGERDSPVNPASPGPLAVLDMLPGVEAASGAPRAVRIRNLGVHALLVPHRAARLPPRPEIRPDPEARWNVLLIRGDPEAVVDGAEVDPADWDYVAIGGPHRGGAWADNVRCPGSLERPGRNPWGFATDERGFLSVELNGGATELHPVPGRAVVDLAPIRLTPGDLDAGTRRLRDLIESVPGGVDGKIVRARFEGDVVSPAEGVSAALISAVRNRAAHLEVRLSGPAGGPRPGAEARSLPGVVGGPDGLQVLAPDGSVKDWVRLQGGVLLVTARSRESREQVAAQLGAGTFGHRDPGNGSRGGGWNLILQSGSEASVPPGVGWAGRENWRDLLCDALHTSAEVPDVSVASGGPSTGSAQTEGISTIVEREAALRNLRADSIEASGDMEARALEWARERQDAESHLGAYRNRATELRRRIRSLEIEGPGATCPTCGRPMDEELPDVLDRLHEEWESLVQDGRWWARRREQLEDKPEDLRAMEEAVLRLHALVEGAGEEIERLRERARLTGKGADHENAGSPAAVRQSVPNTSEAREILRGAGSILSRLMDGAELGLRSTGEALEIVEWNGRARPPRHAERAVVLAALHLAIWARDSTGPGGGAPLLLWELLDDGAADLVCSAIEILEEIDRGDSVVVAVVPPEVLERLPDAYYLALYLGTDERGRWAARRVPGGVPSLTLPAAGRPSRT